MSEPTAFVITILNFIAAVVKRKSRQIDGEKIFLYNAGGLLRSVFPLSLKRLGGDSMDMIGTICDILQTIAIIYAAFFTN